jgi:hypothetical protein
MRECGRIFRYAIATGRAERDIAHDLRGAVTPMRTTRHFAAVTEARAIGRLLLSLDNAIRETTFPMMCALRLAPLVFCSSQGTCRSDLPCGVRGLFAAGPLNAQESNAQQGEASGQRKI